MLTSRNRRQRVANVVHRIFFQHKSANTDIEGAVERLLLLVHRENDDLGTRALSLEFTRDFEPGHSREIDIEHCDVGFLFLDEFQSRFGIARLGDQFKT